MLSKYLLCLIMSLYLVKEPAVLQVGAESSSGWYNFDGIELGNEMPVQVGNVLVYGVRTVFVPGNPPETQYRIELNLAGQYQNFFPREFSWRDDLHVFDSTTVRQANGWTKNYNAGFDRTLWTLFVTENDFYVDGVIYNPFISVESPVVQKKRSVGAQRIGLNIKFPEVGRK